MNAVDIIIKKRDKKELSEAEINYFIHGLTKNEIPDYQVSAWLMTILLNGMTDEETKNLTLAMANSGEILDLSAVVPIEVDKHSTGGVGDKTTLVVEPLVAACGLPVGKMSGRGLGFSGGTLDKIESIPGFRTSLSQDEFVDLLKNKGLVLAGQSGDLAPADGILYKLRDVTGTVQSIPLIASSVMSKKIAGGAQAIVLDVKVGNGAFMRNLEEARQLSQLMVSIGKLSGRRVVALLSDMNQPLGNAVGNALEVKEAISTLKGSGPADFLEHCLTVASHMLVIGEKARDIVTAREIVEKANKDGLGWEKFRSLVINQGGDVTYVDQPEKMPLAPVIREILSPCSGYLNEINAKVIGETSVEMGAGRIKKEDQIDHSVGIIIHHKVGDFVKNGEPLFTIHAKDMNSMENARDRILSAHMWSDSKCEPLPLFYEVIQ
ncbi:MAG: pyrimidine-nucleoside phosphorylase [Chloroflexi bacterium]|nr:MAG: pyrimidine-nucleoside phosphorylase [Chloroflexota bacterium]MBA4376572.1 thymidine phosphorylase [Anaerolinea sp.]